MCPCPRQVPQARGTESSGYITEPEPSHAGQATVRVCLGTNRNLAYRDGGGQRIELPLDALGIENWRGALPLAIHLPAAGPRFAGMRRDAPRIGEWPPVLLEQAAAEGENTGELRLRHDITRLGGDGDAVERAVGVSICELRIGRMTDARVIGTRLFGSNLNHNSVIPHREVVRDVATRVSRQPMDARRIRG